MKRLPDESDLIRAGQRGKVQAVEILFRRYHDSLYRTALRILGNAEDAEDALQDGLFSAYRNLDRFEGRSQFSTWLTRIVINAALMKCRNIKARSALSLDEIALEGELSLSDCLADNEPNPEQVYIATEIRELISKNLDELSPRLRTAFLLREISGYSTSEAAEELGVAENTLKARVWRARRQLALLLQAQRTLVEICWARQHALNASILTNILPSNLATQRQLAIPSPPAR